MCVRVGVCVGLSANLCVLMEVCVLQPRKKKKFNCIFNFNRCNGRTEGYCHACFIIRNFTFVSKSTFVD